MTKLDNLQEALTFDDVLIVPRYSNILSRSEVDTSWKLGKFNFSIPIIAANMDTICGEKMAIKMALLGGLGIIHRYMSINDYISIWTRWRLDPRLDNKPIAFAVGSVHSDKERISWCAQCADIICIDIAHGDSVHMLDTLDYLINEKKFTGPIIAGNVCTLDATRFLMNEGASIVKVGVGPGSVCTTRIKTGCGYPQLNAIVNCSEFPIIADGGIKCPGDAAKALAGGAAAIMIGGLLAGTDCVPGWDQTMKIYNEALERHRSGFTGSSWANIDSPSIVYRGMASKEARKNFGQEGTNAEGVSKTVKCKPEGSTENVIIDLMEGIRSAMSYTGANTLEEFNQLAKFVRVSTTSQIENHPHFEG